MRKIRRIEGAWGTQKSFCNQECRALSGINPWGILRKGGEKRVMTRVRDHLTVWRRALLLRGDIGKPDGPQSNAKPRIRGYKNEG